LEVRLTLEPVARLRAELLARALELPEVARPPLGRGELRLVAPKTLVRQLELDRPV
jgi:hypothetical protein